MRKIIIILIVFLLLNIGFALADNLTLHVRPLSSGIIQRSTNIAYIFNFTTDVNCYNVLLSLKPNITTDSYGIGFVNLNLDNLPHPVSYLCEYNNISGTMTFRKAHTIGSGLFGSGFIMNDLQTNGTINATGYKIGDTSVFSLINNYSEAEIDAFVANDNYYDAVSDIPNAIPNDGDTTHISTADQIFDFAVARATWTSIDSYPSACSGNQFVSGLGDTLTCLTLTNYSETEIDAFGANSFKSIDAICGNTTTEIQAAELDASHDECSEITGCVENAYDSINDIPNVTSITDGETNKFATSDVIYDWIIGLNYITQVTQYYNTTAELQTIPVAGEASGTLGAIVLSHNALDDQYYDSESDLTGLLDNNYKDINAVCGNTSAEIKAVVPYNTTEEYQDLVGAMTSSNTETHIAVTYQDADGTIDFVVSDDWYNSVKDIPNATVSSGDTDHFVVSDMIYEYIVAQNYITKLKVDTNYYNKTLSDANFVSRNAWTDIDDYPSACSGNQFVSGLGDTLVCLTLTNYSETEIDAFGANSFKSIDAICGNTTTEIQAAELDASHDECSEITGCVENALTTTTGDERYITEDSADTMNANLHIGQAYTSGGMTLYSSTYDLFTTGDMIVGDLIGLQSINISSNIIPYKTDLFDIGNATHRYRNSTTINVHADSVIIQGSNISSSYLYPSNEDLMDGGGGGDGVFLGTIRGNSGKINGGVTFIGGSSTTYGYTGGSFYFPRSVFLPAYNDAYSVSFWFKQMSWPTTSLIVYMISDETVSAGEYSPRGYINTEGTIEWNDQTSGQSDIAITSTTKLSNDTWYHIVITHNSNTTIRLYINGINEIAKTGQSSGTADTDKVSYVFFEENSNKFWVGSGDDLRIFNDLLTPSEVTTLYNSGSGTSIPIGDEVKWFTFDAKRY